MMRNFMVIALCCGPSLTLGADRLSASNTPPRIYTSAQARAGKAAYESSCGLCHRLQLQGRTGAPDELPDVNALPANMIKTIDDNGGQVPPLAGSNFMSRWGAKSTNEFVARVATAIQGFPPKNSGKDTSLQLTAYILQMNGAKGGKTRLESATKITLFQAAGQAPP